MNTAVALALCLAGAEAFTSSWVGSGRAVRPPTVRRQTPHSLSMSTCFEKALPRENAVEQFADAVISFGVSEVRRRWGTC